jgi:hypothetical protein
MILDIDKVFSADDLSIVNQTSQASLNAGELESVL